MSEVKRLQSYLHSLRQVLQEMLNSRVSPQHDWLDWEERFHAASLYLYQAGCISGNIATNSTLLSPVLSDGAVEDIQRIPDDIFRSKLEHIEYTDTTEGRTVEGISERARHILSVMDELGSANAPVSPLSPPQSDQKDFSLLKYYYSGSIK